MLLSDLVSTFLKENELPFILKENVLDHRIWGIQRHGWPAPTRNFYIGYVSNRHNRASVVDDDGTTHWIEAEHPEFFERLHAVLLHRLARPEINY